MQVNQVIATVQKDVVSQSDLNALAFIADTNIVLDLHQNKSSRNNRGMIYQTYFINVPYAGQNH